VAVVNLSRLARSGFILILVAMLGLAFYAFFNRPTPITDEDLEATVDARRTQTAVAVTPDFEATIETRLETTPPPPPSGDAIGGVTGIVTGVWDFFGFFGLFSQVICCILLPGLILLGILNDKPRPR
jgi:hypothetical protein